MLDRMSLLLPDWTQRNAADVGITLVELLAYAGDYLSYRQDAIATEAYLGTARRRTSVRRHARLVDYLMHEGCNARTWLHIQVGPNVAGLQLQQGTGGRPKVLTRMQGMPAAMSPDAQVLQKSLDAGAQVFELMHDITLYTDHNEMHFYTWGGEVCCLPKGATGATLKGAFPYLKPGDVLIFTEILGPETGVPQDANPAHRHAVRLTEVTPSFDLLYGETPLSPPSFSPPASSPPAGSPPGNALLAVTEIAWSTADALPFPLCISSLNGIENISVALGNNVLTDHGITLQDGAQSSLQPSIVPQPFMTYAKAHDEGCNTCKPIAPNTLLSRYRPRLLQSPLTYAAPFTGGGPATAAMQWQVTEALPSITLHERGTEGNIKGNRDWKPQRDLLNSAPNAREFVVEAEWDGTSHIRFGNNQQGARPAEETSFAATYRIGNGSSGNIGAGTLGHIITSDALFVAHMQEGSAVWNPIAAHGGQERESMEAVKQYAPSAFRTQQRAVTKADYELFAKRCSPDVQQAAATFRWTGSWKTVFLSADRLEGREVDSAFELYLRTCLEQYRMAGFDLEVEAPIYVSLELEMTVCVNPRFFASDVKKALLQLFSTGILPGGSRGVFHPDNFSFGQPVYLSPLYAAAQSVPGVDAVQITKFERQGRNDNEGVTAKKILLNRREIARLHNDRNYPERGVFNLIMKGGRT